MNNFHTTLPNRTEGAFITDGGLETFLIFNENIELPYFASFPLLSADGTRVTLAKYYKTYADLAIKNDLGFIFESPTWRANPDWASQLGYDKSALANINSDAIAFMKSIRNEYANPANFLVSGCIGPRGDGYFISQKMTSEQADSYHNEQIEVFSQSDADLINAMTMTYPEEAIGITLSAKRNNIPVVISFTTETDGKLPNGMSIEQAIKTVDQATESGPIYYAINCSHPSHFATLLNTNQSWAKRIQCIRSNASCLSHEELDQCDHLEEGDPVDFGLQHQHLAHSLSSLNVFGGCCGTSTKHIEQLVKSCRNLFVQPQ